ncbi:MAG: SUMF1/EgtB/PvdO family nonheme iron enzyme [Bacteroidota bacterium]
MSANDWTNQIGTAVSDGRLEHAIKLLRTSLSDSPTLQNKLHVISGNYNSLLHEIQQNTIAKEVVLREKNIIAAAILQLANSVNAQEISEALPATHDCGIEEAPSLQQEAKRELDALQIEAHIAQKRGEHEVAIRYLEEGLLLTSGRRKVRIETEIATLKRARKHKLVIKQRLWSLVIGVLVIIGGKLSVNYSHPHQAAIPKQSEVAAAPESAITPENSSISKPEDVGTPYQQGLKEAEWHQKNQSWKQAIHAYEKALLSAKTEAEKQEIQTFIRFCETCLKAQTAEANSEWPFALSLYQVADSMRSTSFTAEKIQLCKNKKHEQDQKEMSDLMRLATSARSLKERRTYLLKIQKIDAKIAKEHLASLDTIPLPRMIAIPGGEYQYHKSYNAKHIQPFYLASSEVTNAQFCAFLNFASYTEEEISQWIDLSKPRCRIQKKNGKYVVSAMYKEYPVVYVSWHGARAYCQTFGYQLPGKYEWEYAAGGANRKTTTYPGTNVDKSLSEYAHIKSTGLAHVLSKKPVLVRGNALFGMGGNAKEWCAEEANIHQAGAYRAVRGGSYAMSSKKKLTTQYRHYWSEDEGRDFISFRPSRHVNS